MTRRRTGWTLVDMMIALALVGILTGIALPAVRTGRMRARAALVRSHLDVLRIRMTQVCAALSDCDDPNSTTVYASATNGVTPDWIRDSLTAGQQFDQQSTNGYFLEWVPVSGATTTATRTLGNCRRCRHSDPSRCSGRTITERTTTIASYGAIAVIDVTEQASDLGNQLAGLLGVVVQAQPTGRWANRWVFDVDPIAVQTIAQDTMPTRNARFDLMCS
jgi:Tfp pilus assembly protein PilE